jgi:3-hydroxyisobutyrate dehydrogenase-like beta-hydroxyacid dehydrogenase
MDIGFVGTGSMGAPMVRQLLESGHHVTVHNRTRAKAEALAKEGARVVATPAEAAEGAEMVITMVADDGAELAVCEGPDGILASGPGGLHCACTTLGVATARALAERHREAEQAYLSCPVFGRPEAAAAGRLWILAAGPAEAFQRARPALESMGQGVFELGDDPVAANALKLAGNFTLMAMIETLGEAFALGEAYGIEPQRVLEVVNTSLYGSHVMEAYGKLIAGGDFKDAGFAAHLGYKDARLAQAAAEAGPVPMPLLAVVREALAETVARGRGDWDWAALGGLARERAGKRS